MNLVDETNTNLIASDILISRSFFKRLKGLMFTKTLKQESGMLIQPCNQIHTFHMRYALDILYLDASFTVLAITRGIKPFKVGKAIENAVIVIELNSGRINDTDVKVGHHLKLVE